MTFGFGPIFHNLGSVAPCWSMPLWGSWTTGSCISGTPPHWDLSSFALCISDATSHAQLGYGLYISLVGAWTQCLWRLHLSRPTRSTPPHDPPTWQHGELGICPRRQSVLDATTHCCKSWHSHWICNSLLCFWKTLAANGGLRPSYKKNPITCASSKRRVMLQPFSVLPIPVFYRFPNGVDEVPVIIECRLSRVVAQVKASNSCIPGDDRRAQTKDALTNRNLSAIKEGALCRTERLDDVWSRGKFGEPIFKKAPSGRLCEIIAVSLWYADSFVYVSLNFKIYRAECKLEGTTLEALILEYAETKYWMKNLSQFTQT